MQQDDPKEEGDEEGEEEEEQEEKEEEEQEACSMHDLSLSLSLSFSLVLHDCSLHLSFPPSLRHLTLLFASWQNLFIFISLLLSASIMQH